MIGKNLRKSNRTVALNVLYAKKASALLREITSKNNGDCLHSFRTKFRTNKILEQT